MPGTKITDLGTLALTDANAADYFVALEKAGDVASYRVSVDDVRSVTPSITTGVLLTASDNRAADFGSFDMTFSNIGTASITSVTETDLASALIKLSAATTEVRGNQSVLRFYDSTDANYTGLKGPATGTNVVITLPAALPTANGQLLSGTTGGVASWVDQANITEGSLNAAAADRTADFGTNNLTLNNIGTATITSATETVLESAVNKLDADVNELRGAAPVLRFYDNANTNYTGIKSQATSSGVVFELPTALPATENEYLIATTGGVMSWTAGLPDPFNKGGFANMGALTTAHPSGVLGDFAFLTNGAGNAPTVAIWDSDETVAAWVEATAAGTDLAVGTNDGTTLEVTSSTGANVTLGVATGSVAGLLSAADFTKLQAEPINVTTGTLAAATGDRTVDLGNNDISFTNVDSFNNTFSVQTTFTGPLVRLAATTTELHGNQPVLRFYDSASTNWTGLRGPTGGAGNVFSLPSALPVSNGQLLQSTTAGVMSWVDPNADPNNLGVYADMSALLVAHPTGVSGDFAQLTNGGNDIQWAVWDTSQIAWVVTGESNLSVGTRTGTTLDIDNTHGTAVTLPVASVTEAGLLSAADKVVLDGSAADLALGTVTGTTVEVTSSTGTNVTLLEANGTDAGLISSADWTKIQAEPINFTTGTIPAATAARAIDMGTNSVTFSNVTTWTETGTGAHTSTMASHKMVGTGLSLEHSTASSGATLNLLEGTTNGTDAVTITAPDALAASYEMELLDALPTVQQVADEENYLTIDDLGKLTLAAGGTGGGGGAASDTYVEVVDKASRPTPTADGFRVKTLTNQLIYVWFNANWEIDTYAVTLTDAQFNGLTEVEDQQVAIIPELSAEYQYSTTNGWRKIA